MKFAGDKGFSGEKFNAISLGQGQVSATQHPTCSSNMSNQEFNRHDVTCSFNVLNKELDGQLDAIKSVLVRVDSRYFVRLSKITFQCYF